MGLSQFPNYKNKLISEKTLIDSLASKQSSQYSKNNTYSGLLEDIKIQNELIFKKLIDIDNNVNRYNPITKNLLIGLGYYSSSGYGIDINGYADNFLFGCGYIYHTEYKNVFKLNVGKHITRNFIMNTAIGFYITDDDIVKSLYEINIMLKAYNNLYLSVATNTKLGLRYSVFYSI